MSEPGRQCWAALCARWPALGPLDASTAILVIDQALDRVQQSRTRQNGQDRHGIPPTLGELKAYVDMEGLAVDPEDFLDFYASKDWKVGKARMVDWKASARRWSRTQSKSATKPGAASLYSLQQMLKVIEVEMESIMYPGGCSFKLIPTGDKLARFERLQVQRRSVQKKIQETISA